MMRMSFWFVIGALALPMCVVYGGETAAAPPAGARGPGAAEAARRARTERARAKWAEFSARQGTKWAVRWDDRTGLPRTISAGKSKPRGGLASAGKPEDAARAFLAENAELFGLPQPAPAAKAPAAAANESAAATGTVAPPPPDQAMELRKVREIDISEGTSVTFQQYYRGIPIYKATCIVCTDADGAVWHVTSTMRPDIEVDVNTADAPKGVELWLKSPGNAANPPAVKGEPALVIFPDGLGKLAFRVSCTVGNKRDPWQYIIDARTGDVLEKTHLIM